MISCVSRGFSLYCFVVGTASNNLRILSAVKSAEYSTSSVTLCIKWQDQELYRTAHPVIAIIILVALVITSHNS